jgi:hypothetical protein
LRSFSFLRRTLVENLSDEHARVGLHVERFGQTALDPLHADAEIRALALAAAGIACKRLRWSREQNDRQQ